MQNLGLLVAMLPWLHRQRRDLQQDRRFCRRYYGFFNTNPYLANYLLGGLLRLERDIANGDERAGEIVEIFKDSLGRAFASFGDQLFWMAFRPAFFLLLCLCAVPGATWQLLALVGVFAVWQLVLRWVALGQGFTLGMDIVDLLNRPDWHRAITWTRRIGIFFTGFAVGLLLLGLLRHPPPIDFGAVWLVVVAGLGLPLVLHRRAAGEVIVLGAAALIILGFAIFGASA